VCKVGCHPGHGSCTRPGDCVCATGWQGAYCDECIKYPGCKHGTCHDAPFTCRCLLNWGGPLCDQGTKTPGHLYLDYCGRHRPCKNGGICRNTNSTEKPFQCSCTREYTGDFCEKNIDYCLQNSCLNGGICQDLDGIGFRCICPPGFKGANCQLRSPCSNSRCVHARDCKQLLEPLNGLDYECICQPGWTGQLCDENIDDCADKCQNGGVCHDLIDDCYSLVPWDSPEDIVKLIRNAPTKASKTESCSRNPRSYRLHECAERITGHTVKLSLNLDFSIVLSGCNPNPCQNAAYCYTLSHGFYCKCSPNHYGQFCEHERPYCGPEGCTAYLDPCFSGLTIPVLEDSVNGRNRTDLMANEMSLPYGVCGPHGTCVTMDSADPAGYMCVCSSGFRGKRCQELINHCDGDPCMHSGICINSAEGYECICEEGFVGAQCQTALDLCQPNPCQNGGYCQHTEHPGDFQCRCAPGWSGRWCQLQTDDPCAVSKICLNNGVCHSDPLHAGGFRCDCDPTWMGSVCHLRQPNSRACANKTLCQNGATCVDVGNNFNCICLPGFDGRFCENDINECNSMPCSMLPFKMENLSWDSLPRSSYNNGTCRDLVNAFECDCPKGFIGTDCRINVNECATNPCAYGATCVDRVGDYECICPEGRRGRNCEDLIVYTPPKPPACNFQDRIYDHNETWTYNCQVCQCNMGHIICEDDFCGYWSCLHAVGQSDRFACKEGEVCHILSSGMEGECFVAPCYLRTVCLNASRPIPVQIRELLPHNFPGPSIPGCRPNAARLNNQCARIRLLFSKERMPYSVTVGDICTAVRQLPSIQRERNRIKADRAIGLSCDITAGYTEEAKSTIEITLSATDGHLRVDSNGHELSFIHELAINVSHEIAEKTSTNMTLDKPIDLNVGKHASDRTLPLPPITILLGTPHLSKYWHRVLLGVMEIKVDTMVVKEKDLGSPILVPLACALILATALMCIVFICLYAQRKQRELLLRYAPTTAPNNDLSGELTDHNSMKNHKFGPGGLYVDKRTRPDYRALGSAIAAQFPGTMYTAAEVRNSAVNSRSNGRPITALVV
ncbi:Jagged, partial [Fasciolopsis buskii]